MMKTLLLVCAMTIPRPDCQEAAARVVIQGPDVPNEIMCGLKTQQFIAKTTIMIFDPVRSDEYLKVMCTRTPTE